MTIYRYDCKMRPPALWAVPGANLVSLLIRRIPIAGTNDAFVGAADYSQTLTPEAMAAYDLVYGGQVEETVEEMMGL